MNQSFLNKLKFKAVRASNFVNSFYIKSDSSILLNSLPKSGTNLAVSLAKASRMIKINGPYLSDKDNPPTFSLGLTYGHFDNLEFVNSDSYSFCFTLIRKPDGYISSLYRYIVKNKFHPLSKYIRSLSFEQGILSILNGITHEKAYLPPMLDRYRLYCESAIQNDFLFISYEHLLNASLIGVNENLFLENICGHDYHLYYENLLLLSRRRSSTYSHSLKSSPIDIPNSLFSTSAYKSSLDLYESVIYP